MVPLEKQIQSSTLIFSFFLLHERKKNLTKKQVAKTKKIAYSSDHEARGQKKVELIR